MKSLRPRNIIPSLLFLSLVALSRGQPEPDGLLVSVSQVTDNRTTGSFASECRLELLLTGDAASDALGVRSLSLTKALDQFDRDLLQRNGNGSITTNFLDHGRRNTSLKTQAVLRNPSRNAKVIKVVAGEIALFTPTEGNGGVLRLPGALKDPGEPIANAVLKKYQVEVAYLTKETYEAKKKQFEEAQLKDAPAGAIGAGFAAMFRGMFGNFISSDSKNSAAFLVQDPDKYVVDIELCEANGRPLVNRGRTSSGPVRQMNFESAPPADAQLVIYLATPEAVKSYPFSVENIALP